MAATEATVDCGAGADLQAAINAAPKGAILDVSGRCVGSFTVAKSLTLRGVSAAVLDAGSSSTGPATDPALTISSGGVKVKTLTITGANTSGIVAGGLVNFGTATLVRVTVQGNSGEVAGITNHGRITLQRTTVHSNDAGEDVGGILNLGTATIQRSTIGPNTGTGIFNGSFSGTTPGSLTLVASTVTGNESAAGGGGVENSAGSVTILRSTIAANAVFNSGPGGVGNSATMRIVESTISDNFGDEFTGGLFTFDGGTTTIVATILSGNRYDNLASDCGGTLTTQGHNLIGSSTADVTCSYTARATDQTGVLDPLLKPLGSYGGPTQTMVPKPTSTAVDRIPVGAMSSDGSIALCPSTGTTDQRGIPRPQNGACDIGSVERKPKE